MREHDDWAALDVPDFHVQPGAFTRRITEVEELQLRHRFARQGGMSPQEVDEVMGIWRDRPWNLPRDDDGWAAEALGSFLTRALASIKEGMKTLVGGEIWRTTLRRGEVTQRRIHQLPEEGPLMWTLFAGSMHPIGQVSSCLCGSGELYRLCCLVPYLKEPCGCDSGALLGGCCAVPDTAEGIAQAGAITVARR